MKKKFKMVMLLAAYLVLIGLLASCQKPDEEIELPAPETAFTKSTALGQYIFGISLLNGSADDIIDNAGCLQVVLPVDVTVKGAPTTVSSSADLQKIEALYNLNPYLPDFMEITFPLNVLKPDYTEVTVANQQELDLLTAQCHEVAAENIQCVDFDYPVSFSVYDVQNQVANTQDIHSNRALYNLLTGLGEEDLISVDYPLSLSILGTELTVNDNRELQQTIENKLDECAAGDRKFYTDNNLPLGTISLSLTDAPFPIDLIAEANVVITRIDMKTGAANDSVPFITLFNDTVTYNLLELTNGLTATLGEVPVPAGTYDFFRVYVDEGSVILTDGKSFDLKVPSGNTSGILIKPSAAITVLENESAEYLFDFDLARSFIPLGNPRSPAGIKGFNFRPVIRASNTLNSGTLTGEVTGVDGVPLEGVQVSVLAADTISTTAFTGPDGTYTILGLTPGAYTLEAELSGYQLFSSEEIEIDQAVTTSYDIALKL